MADEYQAAPGGTGAPIWSPDKNTDPESEIRVRTRGSPVDTARRQILAKSIQDSSKGRELTPSQRYILETAQPRTQQTGQPPKVGRPKRVYRLAEDGWARNQVELALILGVTRKTVQRWRILGAPIPRSDGFWNVAQWKEWIEAHGRTSKGKPRFKGPRFSNLARRLKGLKAFQIEIRLREWWAEFCREVAASGTTCPPSGEPKV
jgi:hypothetical protein